MRDKLPQLINTPELRFDCPEERKFQVVDEVKARLPKAGAKVNDIDGVRVSSPGRLVAAARLQHPGGAGGALRERLEAGLERLKADLKAALSASGVELPDEASAHH